MKLDFPSVLRLVLAIEQTKDLFYKIRRGEIPAGATILGISHGEQELTELDLKIETERQASGVRPSIRL